MRGAGGTPGGLGTFLSGAALVIAGGFLLLNQVTVTSGYWRLWGYNAFGLSLFPLLIGIGLLFFNGRSLFGWVLTATDRARHSRRHHRQSRRVLPADVIVRYAGDPDPAGRGNRSGRPIAPRAGNLGQGTLGPALAVDAVRLPAEDLEPGIAGWAAGGIEREVVHPGPTALVACRVHEPSLHQALTDVEDQGLFGVRGDHHVVSSGGTARECVNSRRDRPAPYSKE
jgi:hypothetical protein